MTDALKAVSPLRRRMIDDMSLRNLSPATQRSYLHAVTKFSRYSGRSPDRLGLEDVRAFQVHLVSQGISWPALNQTVCALRFFYGVTLDRGEIPERIAYARTPRKLPVILSADEVVRLLEAVASLKARAALTTAYAAGLRASEAISLKVADIDSARILIQVHHGKGAKDRTVMLSPQLCHASARERGGYQDHPGAAGTLQPVNDSTLHPCGHDDDRCDAKPVRPLEPRGDAANVSCGVMHPALEVADIFRRHGPGYRAAHDGPFGRIERRPKSLTQSRHRSTNPIARPRQRVRSIRLQ
jgi:integrase